jgi:hypothetical protein
LDEVKYVVRVFFQSLSDTNCVKQRNNEPERLRHAGKTTLFQPIPSNDGMLARGHVERLATMDTEHRIVAYITPFLELLFVQVSTSMVVTRSEAYKWLKSAKDTK